MVTIMMMTTIMKTAIVLAVNITSLTIFLSRSSLVGQTFNYSKNKRQVAVAPESEPDHTYSSPALSSFCCSIFEVIHPFFTRA